MIVSELLLKIPRVFRFQWRKFEYKISRKVNHVWFDKVRYKQIMGSHLDLSSPKTLNAKLLWLNEYCQSIDKSNCTDKLKVRDYIKAQGLDFLLVPLLGVWSTPEEIDFDSLPDQFVLKCNHGSACNIICCDKLNFDIQDAKKKLAHWLSIDYGKLYNEKHYSKIKPMILCEVYLPAIDGTCSVIDYKLHCFNGEPQFFLICSDRDNVNHHLTLASYSLDWQRVDFLVDERNHLNEKLPPPVSLEKMLEYARILAKPFPYVRVDFYEIGGSPLFGELTFTPAANIMNYYSIKTQEEMGEKLILPKLNN